MPHIFCSLRASEADEDVGRYVPGLTHGWNVGDVDVLQRDEREDLWVTRLKWGVGPPGGEFKLTGEDVLTIVAGRIKSCYTFLDPK
jgi:hypothetical protein